MRELICGDKKIRVRAVGPALFYYKQEFKADIISDLVKLLAGTFDFISDLSGKSANELTNEDLSSLKEADINISSLDKFNIDSVLLLQIVWAMAKADEYGKQFPSFLEWLNDIDPSCVLDPSFLAAALEEAAGGFLRREKGNGPKRQAVRTVRPGNNRNR